MGASVKLKYPLLPTDNEIVDRSCARKRVRRTQEERRLATRTNLIEAVIAAIQVKGYADLRTSDIVQQADVTWGAAQHIFGDKDELMLQSAMRLSEELLARLNARVDLRQPAAERMSQIVRQTWALYSSPYNFALAEIARGTRFKDQFHDRLAEAQHRVHREIERLWARIFADTGASDGHILMLCNIATLFLSGLAARKSYIALIDGEEPMLEFFVAILSEKLEAGSSSHQVS